MGTRLPASHWCVLIADVVGSSAVPDLRQRRDATLGRLAGAHRAALEVPYTVTAWDEFQAVLAAPPELPRVVWDLRREFHPLELRVGLGIGAIDRLPRGRESVNEVSTGEAFFHARAALEELARGAEKIRALTRLRSGREDLDLAVNLVYTLLDSLLQKLTARQWETLVAHHGSSGLEETARRLGIDESTVSRNLQRGHHWQIVEVEARLRRYLELYLGVQTGVSVP